MRIKASESLLLIVDLQSRLLPAIDDGEAVLSQASWLVDVAQTLGVPVLATEHCPERIGLTDQALRSKISPDCIVAKTHFSAVIEGALQWLPVPYYRILPLHIRLMF